MMSLVARTISQTYINTFLIAIKRKQDLKQAIRNTVVDLKQFKEKSHPFLTKGEDGLLFMELLLMKIESSLIEAITFGEAEKEAITRWILTQTASDDYVSLEFDEDSDEHQIIEFSTLIGVMTAKSEGEFIEYYKNILTDPLKNSIYTYYPVKFSRAETNDGYEYSMTISCNDTTEIIGLTETDEFEYFYRSAEIWSGKSGYIADFIEDTIKKQEQKQSKVSEDTSSDVNADSASSTDEADEETQETAVEHTKSSVEEAVKIEKPPLIVNGKRIEEELVTYIFDDTRTIDLLDTFEGYGRKDDPAYQRIVIKNVKYGIYTRSGYVGFNLVIERSHTHDYTGDITFTEFKKDDDQGLMDHVKSEINDDIIERYLNTDKIYRFKTPYHLRAQNSSNRTGYGWEWDWSGGCGSYTEGTLYGETTDYVFVGAYITSGYSFDKSNRKPFKEKVAENDAQGKQIGSSPKSGPKYKIQRYSGKLKDVTDGEYKQFFLKIGTGPARKYVPVQIDEHAQILYITDANYTKYQGRIEQEEFTVVKTILD